jgi:iron(III) transport system ATP-binding protein
MLIRPESFKLVSAGSHTLSGVVSNITFFGSFYELEVLLAGSRITVRTAESKVAEGDTVHLGLSAADVWYM